MHNDEFILVRAQSANSPSCKRAEVHTKLTHGHTHTWKVPSQLQ